MSGARHKTGSTAVALVAACLLVLQSVLGALAFANSPQATQLDAFGNVICTHDGAAELPGDSHPQPVPPCCAFGCIMAGTTLSPPPATLVLSRGIIFEKIAFAVSTPAPALFPRERSTSNPRAPPLAA